MMNGTWYCTSVTHSPVLLAWRWCVVPEPGVRVVLDEQRGVFDPHFLYEGPAVPQGADLKVDEVVLVGHLWFLQGGHIYIRP